jgi:hypothetical protein
MQATPVTPASTESTMANFNIAGVDVSLRAPARLLVVVDRMLANVSREVTGDGTVAVEARCESDIWYITGNAPSSRKMLAPGAALPQVAGAVIASMLAELSHHHDVRVWRAAVVQHNGNALVLAGDDWESAVTLAAHLNTRGWGLLGGDYALVSGEKPTVMCFKKSLHANSSCLGSFPLWYRPALEASPWYSSDDILAFYAIDPTLVEQHAPWAEAAPIRAFLTVDGHTSEHPSLELGEDFGRHGGVSRAELEAAGIEVAQLVRGRFVETCDFIERWFVSLPSYVQATHEPH